MKEIISTLAAIVFPIATGIAEGWYYHVRMHFAERKDKSILPIGGVIFGGVFDRMIFPSNTVEKTFLNIMRACVYALIGMLIGWLPMIGLWLLFPLLHDGAYYETRNRISGAYPKGWMDYGNSAPQGIDFKFWHRVVLALIGLGIWIYFYIIK